MTIKKSILHKDKTKRCVVCGEAIKEKYQFAFCKNECYEKYVKQYYKTGFITVQTILLYFFPTILYTVYAI